MDTNSQHGNNFSLACQNHNILTQSTKPFVNERHTSSAPLSTHKVSKPTISSIESVKTLVLSSYIISNSFIYIFRNHIHQSPKVLHSGKYSDNQPRISGDGIASPTGVRPPTEQFGPMRIEFLQDNHANHKEWSVSLSILM